MAAMATGDNTRAALASVPPVPADVEEVCRDLDAYVSDVAYRKRTSAPAKEAASLLRSLSRDLATVTAERDEIERLRDIACRQWESYRVRWRESRTREDAAIARAERAEAERDRAIAALRPFARDLANIVRETDADDCPVTLRVGDLTVGDLRAACDVIASQIEEPTDVR